MKGVMTLIREIKIVPVIKLDNKEDAVPLAEALLKGGLPLAEITFRTEEAEEAIREIRTAYPDMLCGAGTIVNLEQAKAAVSAGAAFIVCPGFSRDVIEFALEQKIPVLPGCCTPTEIMEAMKYGLQVVKFFPAKQYGGLDTIKALAAPFPDIRFMPTGGINAKNLREYLDHKTIYACGGSWMAPEHLIKEGKFEEIARLTKEAVQLASGDKRGEEAL